MLTAQARGAASFDATRATSVSIETADSAFPLVLSGPVEAYLKKISTVEEAQVFVTASLERLPALEDRLTKPLVATGLPPELLAVAMAESGFENLPPEANLRNGGPGAAGVWQFIVPTAKTYGLVVEGEVDQRLDIDLETAAAAALLADMFKRFESWPLALAAYNMGPKAVDAAIKKGGTTDAYALIEAGLLNSYASRVMAMAFILEDPAIVGLPNLKR